MGDSHLRPDGFGLLDTMLMPMASPKYSHFNGSLEGPSYVEHFLFLFAFRPWDSLRRVGPVTLSFRFQMCS